MQKGYEIFGVECMFSLVFCTVFKNARFLYTLLVIAHRRIDTWHTARDFSFLTSHLTPARSFLFFSLTSDMTLDTRSEILFLHDTWHAIHFLHDMARFFGHDTWHLPSFIYFYAKCKMDIRRHIGPLVFFYMTLDTCPRYFLESDMLWPRE